MRPPQQFDIEGSWDSIDPNMDFIHLRMLFGSIENWPDIYDKIYMSVHNSLDIVPFR